MWESDNQILEISEFEFFFNGNLHWIHFKCWSFATAKNLNFKGRKQNWRNTGLTLLTFFFSDVIQDKLEVADGAAILSATSRYLSGAGDREGGKAQRDARKAAE